MSNTANRNYPKVVDTHELAQDVTPLQQAADMIDTDVATLFVLVMARSPIGHTHLMSEIEGLVTALAGKAAFNHAHALDDLTDVDGATAATNGQILYKTPAGWVAGDPATVLGNHSHSIDQVINLQAVLDGKALLSHLHTIAQVTGLQGVLDGKADAARTISPGAGLTGGGDLTANRTLAVDKATAAQVRAGTVDKVATADGVLAAMAWAALVDGATIPVDHAAGVNRTVTLAGNRTVDNPSNAKPGYPLTIEIQQDATGGRAVTWGANYSFGTAGPPTLSTAPNKKDLVCFVCRSATEYRYVGISRGH